MTPAATMDGAEARGAVLRAADHVFYQQGVAGTGMAEIRDASGVSLRRLYGMYPSKGDLTEAWLRERHRTWMAWFEGAVGRRSRGGREPLLATFDAIGEWAATPGYRGCAFLNTAAETTEIQDRHRSVIAGHKRDLIAYLSGLAREGGYRRPGEVGEAIGVLIDGAIVQSAVLSSRRPISAARTAAATMLKGYR
jgi:AcrR family transcriptional regulator